MPLSGIALQSIYSGNQPRAPRRRHLNIDKVASIGLLSTHNQKFIIIFYFVNLATQAPWVGLPALLRPLRTKLIKCHFQLGSEPLWAWVCCVLDCQDAINELINCILYPLGLLEALLNKKRRPVVDRRLSILLKSLQLIPFTWEHTDF